MLLRSLAVVVLLTSLICPCFSQAQNPAPKPIPVKQDTPADYFQEKLAAAVGRQMDELEIGYKDVQLRNEVALAEEKINTLDALHSLVISDWTALKSYSDSTGEDQRRNEFTQAINNAYNTYNQSYGQLFGSSNNVLSQHWSTLNQSRQSTQQMTSQSMSEVMQNFNRQMSAFIGRPKAPAMTDCIINLTPAVAQTKDEAELAYNKQVNQARATYQANIDQATEKWKTSLNKIAGSWNTSAPNNNALRQANRDWLISAIDALDNLRNSFKSAVTKYRLQVLE